MTVFSRLFLLAVLVASCVLSLAFAPPRHAIPSSHTILTRRSIRLLAKESVDESSDDSKEEAIDRTSFDQAGRSLMEEEDQQRLEQMGDFDSNPEVRTVERNVMSVHISHLSIC